MSATRLQHIVAAHRHVASLDPRSFDELLDQARQCPPTRDFCAALRQPGLSVIAEVKRKSPSVGDLDLALDPATLARAYEQGGARCLSVLTDVEFFGGSVEDLQAARAAVSLPVLRKDFTVDERDILDARIMGADAVLLIVAALDDDELSRFHRLARSLDLAVLVEVHDGAELTRALAIEELALLGVNQRNLHTFAITGEAVGLRPSFPPGVIGVAESGIATVADAQTMAGAGYDAILVGTSLVTSGQPEVTTASFASVVAH